jgi:uncharacterized protein YoxC
MENAETILVIILSTTLAIFLVLGIILISALIKLTSKMREIANTAQQVADNVESASEVLKNTAGPLAAGKILVNIADAVFKKRRGGR